MVTLADCKADSHQKGLGRSFLNNFTVDFHDSRVYWLYSLECRIVGTGHQVEGYLALLTALNTKIGPIWA